MRQTILTLGVIFWWNVLMNFPVNAVNNAHEFATHPNQCVRCHSQIAAESNKVLAGAFTEWQSSDHRKHGIFCNDCHGGDPGISGANEAHSMIKNSEDPGSLLYSKNIPQTCGQCHEMQFEYFRQSFHYQKLEKSNIGPTCVTCHGSRKNSVLKPVEVKEKCALCHNGNNHPDIPKRIVDFFIFLNQVKLDILKAENSILKAESSNEKVDLEGFQNHLEKAVMITVDISKKWHLFDIEKTYATIMDAHKEANLATVPQTNDGKVILLTIGGLLGLIIITTIVIASRRTKKA